MLERVFPPAADFTYRGSRIALWLLGLILVLKLAIALGAIFNGHHAAAVADGIPIDSYTPQGTQAFLSLFASLGLSQFMLAVFGVVVIARYRALVPLFLLLLLVEYVARKCISAYLPIVRTDQAPGGAINWAIFGIIVLAFILSIRRSARARTPNDV